MANNPIQSFYDRSYSKEKFQGITTGVVVDTNDPLQMGRVRAVCPSLGDTENSKIDDLPWAMAATPLGGVNFFDGRGPGSTESKGAIAYGMFGTPTLNTRVLITCIDGNTDYRVWIACLHGQHMAHTMPHGRFIAENEETKKQNISGILDGPLTSNETPIQPLYDNLTAKFTKKDTLVKGTPLSKARHNYEWLSRGADFGVGGVPKEISSDDKICPLTSIPDTNGEDIDIGSNKKLKYSYGYAKSRDPETPNQFDPSVYSWTSAGFHSIAMDDRPENCRIRIRTTSGNQLIMDDTNERIYISTAEGKSWIEIDQKGNIDLYSDRSISFRAKKDINFTSDESIRFYGKQGIYMYSDSEIRVHANKELHLRGEEHLRYYSGQGLYFESVADVHFKSATNITLTAATAVNIGGGTLNLNAPGQQPADDAKALPANWPSRVPEHEPWARVVHTKKDNKKLKNENYFNSQFEYTDKDVNQVEWGEKLNRNSNWRR